MQYNTRTKFSYEKNERIVRSRANSFLAFFSANLSVVKFDFSTKKNLKSEKTAKKKTLTSSRKTRNH